MNRIVWLASYPKSGNTWLRAFLTNVVSSSDSARDINSLIGDDAAARRLFDDVLGMESSEMTHSEIQRYRPSVYRQIAFRGIEPLFLKVHDAYTLISAAEPLIPADASRGAVYLTRNPLDIAVSLAHHAGLTLNSSIESMADETFAFSSSPERLNINLTQCLLSWSGHVRSWLDQKEIPVHLMRYEDAMRDPLKAFTDVLRFIGMDRDMDGNRACQAIRFSSFDVLRGQEIVSGFRERPSTASAFFRSGRVGEWREVLTGEQVARIVSDHGNVMRRLGYLTADGVVQ